MPKIVSLAPPLEAAAGLTSNRATMVDIRAALMSAPKFMKSVGLSEGDVAELGVLWIGKGHYAHVFKLHDGRILKITDDADDAMAAELIRRAVADGEIPVGLPYIDDVKRFKPEFTENETDDSVTRPLFAIVSERVVPMKKFEALPISIRELLGYMAKNAVWTVADAAKFFRGEYRLSSQELLGHPEMVKVVDQVMQGVRWLDLHGISVRDLHERNFGTAAGGRAALFDFGHNSHIGPKVSVAVAKNPAFPDPEMQDVFVEHVRASSSLDEAIEDLRRSGETVVRLPGGKQISTKEAIATLESWRPRPVTSPTMTVFHGTDAGSARRLLIDGFVIEMKPVNLAMLRHEAGEYAEFAPGRGISRGLYVSADPSTASGFGPVILELRVPRSFLDIPPEQIGKASSVEESLRTEDGAVITKSVPAEQIRQHVRSARNGQKPTEEKTRQIWRAIGSPDVDLNELRMGIEVEQEHGVDMREAGKIAMDHLREFPDYYTRLTKMEARAKAGLAPNPTKMPYVQAAFNECFDRVERDFPDFGALELHEDDRAGADNGHGSERQFGYCMDGKPIRIAFAVKTEDLPVANIRGLMAHEFGHALDYRYGKDLPKLLGQRLPDGVERRADAIAKAVFGRTIKYDERDIQCVQCRGVGKRPERLGP